MSTWKGVVAALGLGLGCSSPTLPPTPQLLVYIDTDAVVPSNVSVPFSVLNPVPLFDHIRIDGIHDGATCSTCSHDYDVYKETFEAKEVSFGVLSLAPGDRIRVRLYLLAYATAAGIPSEVAIDVTATLPALPTQGIAAYTLVLRTDDVGRPWSAELTPGAPSASVVGTWSGAHRVACKGTPRQGEVCIPGGAFWMGNPLVAHTGTEDGDGLRLVVLSSFFLDAKEVTVAEYRASHAPVAGVWSEQIDCSVTDYCTFTASSGPYEDFPINCVDPDEATAYCGEVGKQLPTEAEFEYVASSLSSQTYVWGEDPPGCADAVLARAGLGFYANGVSECLPVMPAGTSCMDQPTGGLGRGQAYGGPAPGGSGARDRLMIDVGSSKGTVIDLVGNLLEYMRDSFEPLSGPCWSAPGVYQDPVCTASTGLTSIRGGSWTTSGAEGRAASRDSIPNGSFVSAEVGFRCARQGL
jgi:formylglycine-generating enzyme